MVESVRGALIFSLLPLYGQHVASYSLGMIGTAISLHYLLDNGFRIPAGWLSDRLGGKEIASLYMLYPGMFAQTMAIGILMPILVIYAQTVYGFSTEQFSYLLIGGGGFTVLLLIPAGKFADRMRVKGPLVGGFLMAAIALALLPLQQTGLRALVVGVFLGIAYSFILPAWNGLQARVVSPEKRGDPVLEIHLDNIRLQANDMDMQKNARKGGLGISPC